MFRYALSSAGDMHLGDLRIALVNFIMAKQAKERLVIRMDDLSSAVDRGSKEQENLQLLSLFGLTWDGLYYRSANLRFHRQIALDMLHKKTAFSCFCRAEVLDQKKELAASKNEPYHYDGHCENLPAEEVIDNEQPFSLRIKRPISDIGFKDVLRGDVTYPSYTIDSYLIMRKEKVPTDDFACAVDDVLQDIGYIIQGEDCLDDIAKQIWLREQLGYDKVIHYAHLPAMVDEKGEAVRVRALLEEGYLPSAIAHYLLGADKGAFSIDDAVAWFDIKSMATAATQFDIDRLREINREHLRVMDPLKLASMINFASADMGEIAKLYLETGCTLNEIADRVRAIFEQKEVEGEMGKVVGKLKEAIKQIPYHSDLEHFTKELMEQTHLSEEELRVPLYVLVTGYESGPKLSELYPLVKNYIEEIAR
jgi:glutamyl-tRNA synthetase